MRGFTLAIVLSSVVMATPALARRGGPMGKGMGGRGGFSPVRIEAVAAQLGLSDATLTQIKDLSFKAEQEAIAIRAEVQREQLTLRKLMDVDSPDEKAVMRQIDELMAQEARMRKNRVGLLIRVRKLLTPEQRAQLEQLMMQRRGRGPMGGAGMGGTGMGGTGGRGMGGTGGRGMGPGGGIGPGPGAPGMGRAGRGRRR